MTVKDMRVPDARGWVMIGSYALVVMLIAAWIWGPKELRSDDYFKSIATLLIGTAWVNGSVAWAFAATKQGGELADRNATIVENQASKGN